MRSLGSSIAVMALAMFCLALAGAAAANAATLKQARAKAPKRGQYIGQTRERQELTLYVARRRVRVMAIDFQCGYASGRAKLRRIKLRRTRRGFRFAARRTARVTYSAGSAPEVGSIRISGRFTRTGKRVRGRARMRSRFCGRTGTVRWGARYTSPPVRAPRSGEYDGETRQRRDLALHVAGRQIQLAAIEFRCGGTTGHTNLNGIPLRQTRRGFSFSIRAHGLVSWGDGQPDQNAAINLSGRFSRGGKKARGRVRVKAPRCGSGRVRWVAKRRRAR
jgi:hypothetical protein